MRIRRFAGIAAGVMLLVAITWLVPVTAQVRGAHRPGVAKCEEGKGGAAGPRGVAVKGEDGYAAAGRNGAVAKGDEGYAAVGRHGAVAKGEDDYARVGPHGAVVAGEEGYAAVGRRGVVVGDQYESYDAWKAVAGAAAVIAVGTMLTRPPAAAVTINVEGSSYYYSDGAYYTRVMSGGDVSYQVVAAPPGAIIATLPGGCKSVHVGNVAYSQCGTTYYERVAAGYRVVVL